MAEPDTSSLPDAGVRARLAETAGRRRAELEDFVRFPSVSGVAAHEADVADCAEWLAGLLGRAGLDGARLLPAGGSPLVYAEWLRAPGAPTLLVYGHYDVQPPGPEEAWSSPPFEPTERDGRLYGRGTSDEKAQILAAIHAVEAHLAAHGRLPCNVRFLVEGEEETRADHFEAFLAAQRETGLLDADVALVTDCSVLAEGVPGVMLGLRGMVAIEVTVRTAAADLHSGVWGGIVPNAALALAQLLAGLRDPATGAVLVDGFYDGVEEVPPHELADWAGLPLDETALVRETGVERLTGETGYSVWERRWARPTLDVCGVWGGYRGEEISTVIPAEAHAKLSCRVVPGQDAAAVLAAVRRHLETHAPPGARVEVDWELLASRPVLLDADDPAVQAALDAVRDGFGVEPALFRGGFSVPAVELLDRVLGLRSVLLGFTHPDENMHAPDEFVRLDVVEAATVTYAALLDRLAQAAGAV